ncbi:hypothetical protein Tco_1279506, partial [Tanacetum coccineum]
AETRLVVTMAGGWRLWCFDEDGAKVVVVIEWLLWEVYMVVVSWMKVGRLCRWGGDGGDGVVAAG